MNKGGWRPVGTVSVIARYPLKAAGGEHLDSARMGWHGLHFDRRFALLRLSDLSGLPWVSPREFPQTVTWRAVLTPETGGLRVCLPGGDVLDVFERDRASRAALEARARELLGEDLRLMSLWSGTHDAMTLSLITTASIASAAAAIGEKSLDVKRFRPNIVIDTGSGSDPWPERKWVGREIRIGAGADATVVRVDRHTTRCEVIDLDPTTGRANSDLFATVRSVNRNRVGVYGTPTHVGLLAVGATVYIR